MTKGNAILAYEEIFKMWKVELDLQQEKTLKEVYFSQAWDKWQTKDANGDPTGNLDLKDSFRFLNDLMTLQKQPQVMAQMPLFKPKQKFLDFGTSFTQQKTSPYLQALTQQAQLNFGSMGLDDNNVEAVQTEM